MRIDLPTIEDLMPPLHQKLPAIESRIKADVATLLGIFLARGHLALMVYAPLVFFGLHVWVVLHEEPVVHARLGEDWKRYVACVPRWIGWRREADG